MKDNTKITSTTKKTKKEKKGNTQKPPAQLIIKLDHRTSETLKYSPNKTIQVRELKEVKKKLNKRLKFIFYL